ncbi:MAG: terminase small subunit [Rhodobacteraceae bacterium]|nr:terminase small subunit [Paracoccaceae bacterium]
MRSKSTPESLPRLLANVKVAAAIAEAQQGRAERTEINADWVLTRLGNGILDFNILQQNCCHSVLGHLAFPAGAAPWDELDETAQQNSHVCRSNGFTMYCCSTNGG